MNKLIIHLNNNLLTITIFASFKLFSISQFCYSMNGNANETKSNLEKCSSHFVITDVSVADVVVEDNLFFS